MERATARDVREMESASAMPDGAETVSSRSSASPAPRSPEARREQSRALLAFVTPPAPDPDVLDLLDAGLDFVDRFLFGRW